MTTAAQLPHDPHPNGRHRSAANPMLATAALVLVLVGCGSDGGNDGTARDDTPVASDVDTEDGTDPGIGTDGSGDDAGSGSSEAAESGADDTEPTAGAISSSDDADTGTVGSGDDTDAGSDEMGDDTDTGSGETGEPDADDGASESAGTDPETDPVTGTVPAPVASTVEGLLALQRPLVIAHAGGDQDYPHSTLYAYAQAAAAGADILELDVQLTADGVLIVQHDDTVDRTTETSGPVSDFTLAEIQALDNAYWFVAGVWGDQTLPDERYVFRGVRTGEVDPPEGFVADDFRVATFREVAERFGDYVLDVEIKLQPGADGAVDPATGIAAAEVLAAEIAEMGREDSVVVTSFNDEVVAAFSELAPSVATTPGEAELLNWYLAGTALDSGTRIVQVPLTYQGIEVVTPETVARIHDEGVEVWVWLSGTDVVESREFYSQLVELGVDGIIAGRPAEAVAALVEDAG